MGGLADEKQSTKKNDRTTINTTAEKVEHRLQSMNRIKGYRIDRRVLYVAGPFQSSTVGTVGARQHDRLDWWGGGFLTQMEGRLDSYPSHPR